MNASRFLNLAAILSLDLESQSTLTSVTTVDNFVQLQTLCGTSICFGFYLKLLEKRVCIPTSAQCFSKALKLHIAIKGYA